MRNDVQIKGSADEILSSFNEASTKLDKNGAFDAKLAEKPTFDFIKNLYASFHLYENFGLEDGKEDKTVNAHNCRKSAILSQMFILHKLVMVGGADQGLNTGIKSFFIKYATAYLELTSVVTDLQMYVPHLEES